MMATHTNKDAHNIMHIIKEGTIGAEIGIWMGNTSTQFLKKGLKKFYMVDAYSIEPYRNSTEADFQTYLAKYAAITGEIAPTGFQRYYDRVYKEIKDRFESIKEVEICRMTSDKFFEEFDGEKLDWIYVDGDHSYEGCFKDLNNALKIVKPGGKILGDDYGWPEESGGKSVYSKPGVTKAVKEFINNNNLTKHILRHGQTQFEIQV